MQFLNRVRTGSRQSWVRRAEHFVLRLVSMAFSLGSAHAIRWFFAPLDGIDRFQPFITWMIAVCFGVLGYFVSRGLAHRLMNKEQIWAYAPICVVVEFVEIFCNYALAAAVIQQATWLSATPPAQRTTLTVLTYVALSIIPLVSLLLAVVDMDLERHKHRGETAGVAPAMGVGTKAAPAPAARPTVAAAQPKQAGPMDTQGMPVMPTMPTYQPYQQGLRPAAPMNGAHPPAGAGGTGAAAPFVGVRPASPPSLVTTPHASAVMP